MLFEALFRLHRTEGLRWLYVVRFTSTRIILATLTALLMSFIIGPWFINRLRSRQIGEQIRTDGPETHKKKAGTPTMGGSLIILCLVVPCLLWCDLKSGFVWLILMVTVGYGVIGFLDDYLKISRKNKKGLPGRFKMLGQITIGGVAMVYLYTQGLFPRGEALNLALPFTDYEIFHITLPLAVYIGFALFVVVGTSNAVNITDGLDGLAIGPVIVAAAAFLILAYIAGVETTIITRGHPEGVVLAQYLKVPHVPAAAELAIYCGAMIGAGVGFLWYNAYPASVFMGDVGALALGGGLGMLAVLTKNEITMVILGGVFVVEILSVVIQVASFKLTGKRVFKMAPLHHHFELKGWHESKVIVRFWIVSILLALVALGTLKLR
ncbi:MAG: phospho-N-acetylmuramoyl-pentapeptide-transferase [Deltaproteobacteria bacterium]|jgi:phospho-N-acetylmuramoyl-pentapeptide-transferase|nr:phospho-N-acetylmuramoyl-pentapeptide-transferase [Deltaproteobacteria bacterium]